MTDGTWFGEIYGKNAEEGRSDPRHERIFKALDGIKGAGLLGANRTIREIINKALGQGDKERIERAAVAEANIRAIRCSEVTDIYDLARGTFVLPE